MKNDASNITFHALWGADSSTATSDEAITHVSYPSSSHTTRIRFSSTHSTLGFHGIWILGGCTSHITTINLWSHPGFFRTSIILQETAEQPTLHIQHHEACPIGHELHSPLFSIYRRIEHRSMYGRRPTATEWRMYQPQHIQLIPSDHQDCNTHLSWPAQNLSWFGVSSQHRWTSCKDMTNVSHFDSTALHVEKISNHIRMHAAEIEACARVIENNHVETYSQGTSPTSMESPSWSS